MRSPLRRPTQCRSFSCNTLVQQTANWAGEVIILAPAIIIIIALVPAKMLWKTDEIGFLKFPPFQPWALFSSSVISWSKEIISLYDNCLCKLSSRRLSLEMGNYLLILPIANAIISFSFNFKLCSMLCASFQKEAKNLGLLTTSLQQKRSLERQAFALRSSLNFSRDLNFLFKTFVVTKALVMKQAKNGFRGQAATQRRPLLSVLIFFEM